jgi:phage terminase small subunit
MRVCTPQENRAAELFVAYGNQTKAWREAVGKTHEKPCQRHWTEACHMFALPWVRERVREVRAEYAAARIIDVQALVARDLRVVEASEHAHLLSRYVYRCCRHCHGIDFDYQWVDDLEFANALVQAEEANAERRERNQRGLPLPNDRGGYGFDADNDPNPVCPRCEGVGIGRAIIGDTRELGPAAALFKGIKVTANGIEVQTHDVDKAIDRLLRITGALGDDAASVARGAAAGAAAGASAGAVAQALAAAKAAQSLTTDQVQQLYLRVMNG